MITEIYEFWFFWSKNGRFVTHICFPKKGPETPIFIVFFGCALSGPRCQKREILKSQPKKKEKFDWQLKSYFLGVFAVFFGGFFFSCFFFLCFFCFFFGGFKGQVRWPEGPPHLALNPPYFFFLFFFCCFFGFFWRVKGQVRWPKGPRHLALNPPYCFFFCFLFCFFVFCFVFWLFNTKNLVFS